MREKGMAKNNVLWKIISILVTLGILAGGAIYGYASLSHEVVDNGEDIAAMEPDVQKNNEHRIKFEEKITNMESDIKEILVEVKK